MSAGAGSFSALNTAFPFPHGALSGTPTKMTLQEFANCHGRGEHPHATLLGVEKNIGIQENPLQARAFLRINFLA